MSLKRGRGGYGRKIYETRRTQTLMGLKYLEQMYIRAQKKKELGYPLTPDEENVLRRYWAMRNDIKRLYGNSKVG